MDKQWEAIFEEVKQNRPSKERMFEYTFLPSDKVRLEKNSKQEVLVIAEDKWSEKYGMCLVTAQSGKVYVADIENYEPCTYCAGSFGQFVRIAEKYWEVADGGVDELDTLEGCEEQEKWLREAIEEIDATALDGEEYFWSVIVEEVGYGI
ncbi:MAG: hypothetical protein IJX63_11945 [Lachnospiraceae bacterium]|nr:hypothetical protein [Lachnospiraceae bacterium]